MKKYDIKGNNYWNIVKNGEPYSNIRQYLNTFDMIFFRGSEGVSDIISKIQKKLNGKGVPDYTHVGLIIRASDFPQDSSYYDANKIYVFESTQSGSLGDGTPNINFESKLGVQLRDFDKVVETYDNHPKSKLAWAPMLTLYRPIFNLENSELLLRIVRKYEGIRYDVSVIDLFSAVYKPLRPLRRLVRKFRKYANDWQFCSELCCNVYKDFGILNETINAENVLPCDFMENLENRGTTYDKDNKIPVLFHSIIPFTNRLQFRTNK
jgi:hypothetical protein